MLRDINSQRNSLTENASSMLFLVALIFGPLAFGCVEPWSVAILEAILFSALLVRCCSPLEAVHSAGHRALLLALLAIVLLGLTQWFNQAAIHSPAVLWPYTVSGHNTGNGLLLWMAYASMIFCAPGLLRQSRHIRILAWTLFMIGFVISLIGLVQKSQGAAVIYGIRPVLNGAAPFGPYYNPNHAASLMAMSLFVGLGIFFGSMVGKHQDGVGAFFDRIAIKAMIGFIIVVIFLGILGSGSRGALVSLVVSIMTVGPLILCGIKGRNRLLILAGLGLTLSTLAAMVYVNRSSNRFNLDALKHGSAYRMALYRSGSTIVADFPNFGVGMGSLAQAFPPYQVAPVQGRVEHAHSDWLELLVQTGTVGFACLCIALIVGVKQAVRVIADCPSSELKWMTYGAFAATVAFLMHSFVEGSFQIPANAVIFLSLLAWIGSSALVAGVGRIFLPQPIAFCLSLVALCSISLSAYPAIGWWYASKANEAALGGSRAMLLNRAIRWDSRPNYFYLMGSHYLNQAETTSAAGTTVLLREGLVYSSRAFQADPVNPRFRHLQGALLLRLGRFGDAQALLQERSNG